MPALSNAKHERMAQLMAQGKAPSVAYAVIHPKLKRPDSNVGRFLKMHPQIQQRVAELQQEALVIEREGLAHAQAVVAVDRTYVLRNLKEIVERCMQSAPVLDRDGDQVYVETKDGKVAPAYGFDPKPAVAALRLLGMEIGMFVQRHAEVPDPFRGLPAPVVQQIMEALVGVRAGRLIEHVANKSAAATPTVPRLDSGPSA